MNRVQIYPGAIPLETDLLTAQKNDMIGLAKLSAAVLGTTTQVNGLACNPNGPPALNVMVSPGEIYSSQNIDNTAYSSLAADTTHQIIKQGILLDALTLATPAPGTAGQSINYLIQATYTDVDTNPVVLPYYNASNPTQAYSGPANAGTTNNTTRNGVCTVAVKTGIAAATGSQLTPAADAGYTALYVVTVANGQASVTAPNIVAVVGAPFLSPAAMLNTPNTFTQFQSAPTPAAGDNTTKLATTAMLQRDVLGLNQTFTNVTGSRVLGTTYTNSTGKPIVIYVYGIASAANGYLQALVNGVTGAFSTQPIGGNGSAVSLIIPAGGTYSVVAVSATLSNWNELR